MNEKAKDDDDNGDIFTFTLQTVSSSTVHCPALSSSSSAATASAPRRRTRLLHTHGDKLLKAKEDLISGRELKRPIDRSLFPDLVDVLQKDYESEIDRNEFKQSKITYGAFKKAQEYYLLVMCEKKQEEIQNEINVRLKTAQTDKRSLQKTIHHQEQNMNSIFLDEENSLSQKHRNEFESFNQQWENGPRQRSYNKTSDSLKILRKQADCLLLDGQYRESAMCERRADEVEAAEVRQKGQEMERDYAASLRMLFERQNNEMKVLKGRHKMKRNEYQAAKNEEIARVDGRIAKIETELEKANSASFINGVRKAFIMENPFFLQNRQNSCSQCVQNNDTNNNDSSNLNYSRNNNNENNDIENSINSRNMINNGERRANCRSYRNIGRKEIIVAEFNEVQLPPLRSEEIVKKAMNRNNYYSMYQQQPSSARRSVSITPRRKEMC